MKKLSVIIATVLFSFGVATAMGPAGDDTNEASHDVEISIPTSQLFLVVTAPVVEVFSFL
ncbi:hypothetical protein DET65_1464 [Sunxiuqinia elliptica]|uniref:Uncharacterized protein n=1 Tax=Sunxiuqinia elliptica TaxID=655355 RepID=A0A4R6HBL0_9BACT|nr:hypothetical protein DET52_101906 [Sunxiuqinia elliptica]TDO65088.1 hypothetical protein DET65_1464 [Sunxiuqinia elliptica]